MEGEYRRAQSLSEATTLLADDPWGAKAVSGGTAVVLMMRQNLIAPSLLVGIDQLPELHGVDINDKELRIGAATTLAQIAGDSRVHERFASLAHACSIVANVRVRNVATVGGNLAEADYASDPPSVLASLGASCTAVGVEGSRSLGVLELIEGFYSTTLEPGELITDIRIPLPQGDQRTAYLKYISRSSEDRPCVGVAARGVFEDDVVTQLDVVVGAVAPTPQTFPAVTGEAIGRSLSRERVGAIAGAYGDAVDPLDDLRGSSWYRKRMIEVFVRRALEAIKDSR